MKKKLILAIAAVGAAAACFGACGKNNGGFNHYDEINKLFNLDYSKIEVTVTDTFDADTVLVSTYTVTYSGDVITVVYNIEEPTGISMETGALETTKYTGTATINNGVVDDSVGKLKIDSTAKITFKASYFSNVNEALLDIKLDADVKNPSAFMGTQIACTDMHVVADYFDSFSSMEITYTGEKQNSVKINYIFTV